MMIVKANKDSEAGKMPSEALLAAMAKYNEELVNAGILVDLAGLQSSSKGFRVRFSGGKTSIIDGPFAETKEQLLGFYLVDCASLEEAIEVAREMGRGESGAFEVRPVRLFRPGVAPA